MKDNVVVDKSYGFALYVIKTYKEIVGGYKEFVLSKQFLKCGTSIGANVREAVGGQTKADFIAKMPIAYKEALETEYWISLLRDSEYIDQQAAKILMLECAELSKIISSILITSKSNNKFFDS